MLPRRHVDALVEIPYVEIEAVNIGGAGLMKSGGGFVGGGGAGAIIGITVAAALNSLTTRYTVETIVQIQAGGREIFLLHTVLEPDRLRIELSPAFAAIRQARPYPTNIPEDRKVQENSISQVEALDKLMSMFDRGLLTRDEFDRLKAKVIAESA